MTRRSMRAVRALPAPRVCLRRGCLPCCSLRLCPAYTCVHTHAREGVDIVAAAA